MIQLDHIVIAAQTLEQGVSYVEDILEVKLTHGGKHLMHGTHNKALRLNDCYLEVIAPDPDSDIAPPWFGLGNEVVLESLQTPRLLTWVARCDKVQEMVKQTDYPVNVQEASRDNLRWQFSFPNDGSLIGDGVLPYLIQWESEPAFYALPETGSSLLKLEGFHPKATEINSGLKVLGLQNTLEVKHASKPKLVAYLQTPTGLKVIE
jgi:hypothetical protein